MVIDDCEEAASFLEDPFIHVNRSLTRSQENTIESSVKSLVSEAAIILQSSQNSNQIKAARDLLVKMKAILKATDSENNSKRLPKKSTKRKQEIQQRNFLTSSKRI